MTNRGPTAPDRGLLAFNKANDSIIFQLVAEAAAHLTCKEGVVLQTIYKIIAGKSFAHKLCHVRCNFP